MKGKGSKKIFLTMLLAVIAVFAMFGSAWAAPTYATGTIAGVTNNADTISSSTIKTYYLNGATAATDINVVVEITPDANKAGVYLEGTGVTVRDNGGTIVDASSPITFTSGVPVTLQLTMPISAFSGGNVSVAIKDNVPSTVDTITIQAITVMPTLDGVTNGVVRFGVGLTNPNVSVTIKDTNATPLTLSFTGLGFWKDGGGSAILTNTAILGDATDGIVADLSSLGTNSITLKEGSSSEGSATSGTFFFKATTFTVGTASVAGFTPGTTKIGGDFTVEVVNPAITLTEGGNALPDPITYTVGVSAAVRTITVTPNFGSITALTVTDTSDNVLNIPGLTISVESIGATGTIKLTYNASAAAVLATKAIKVKATLNTAPVTNPTVTFNVRIDGSATYAMSLDPDSFTRVVSADNGTQSGKVILKQSGSVATPALTDLVISADNVSGASGSGSGTVSWNGLTIKASTASPATGSVGTVTITGKPNAVDSGKTFYLLAKSGSGTISNTSFSIRVSSGSISVVPSTPTYYVGTTVSSGTALTVTSNPQISSLTIKKDGESGSGSSSSTWNDLTFAVTSTTNVAVVGTPRTTGTQKFILTGTNGSGTVDTSFTVTVAPSGGTVIITPNPVIVDESGNSLTTMRVGELMTMFFGTNVDLSSNPVYVYVTRPDGSPAVLLTELPTKTGQNGYVVNPSGITVYYEPTMNGQYKFTFRYTYAGQVRDVDAYLNAGGYHSSGGSSGCDAGLGMMALLAAGGLLMLRKRRG